MAKPEDLEIEYKREILTQGMAFCLACEVLSDENMCQRLRTQISSSEHWALTLSAKGIHDVSALSDEEIELKFAEIMNLRGNTNIYRGGNTNIYRERTNMTEEQFNYDPAWDYAVCFECLLEVKHFVDEAVRLIREQETANPEANEQLIDLVRRAESAGMAFRVMLDRSVRE
ncbi:MAG: hypothetical protein F6K45_07545 [Kamptonema sp. SIO1D9]|nr:hypothetical protein [Kamptonema sp. SIO1D9]